jgi:hypothetical protein
LLVKLVDLGLRGGVEVFARLDLSVALAERVLAV